VASGQWRVGSVSRVIRCLLPTAYCLLPTAYCLLPTAIGIGGRLGGVTRLLSVFASILDAAGLAYSRRCAEARQPPMSA
jgi:hypothetical protein